MGVSVILISGKQGSGKSTLSERLTKVLHSRPGTRVVTQKFAGPLYRMHDFCLTILKAAGIDRQVQKDGTLLQLLRTEWGRKTVDENIWVKCAQAEVARVAKHLNNEFKHGYIILDDCRFKNELLAFPDAVKVRLECPKVVRRERCEQWRENDMHPSEVDLDDWVLESGRFDLIFNTGTVSADHCARIIAQVLDRGGWADKRGQEINGA